MLGLVSAVNHPGAKWFVAAVVLGGAALALGALSRPPVTRLRDVGRARPANSKVLGLAGLAVLLYLMPLLGSELFIFRLGNVLIAIVAVTGLHILFNWAGELSLAHAGMIGLPALIVGNISQDQHISPLHLIPLGILIGSVAGASVGLAALRARGLYVAIVTIAAQLGIQSFFFTKHWVVGAGAVKAAQPSLGPIDFTTNRGLYPVIVSIFLLAVLVAWALYHSKVAHALLWIKANPAAAAAAGVPVATYRFLAYAVAGAFAGLGGSLAAGWVQQLSPSSYDLFHSLSPYLIIVVLAGPGFLGGVIGAAFGFVTPNVVIPSGIPALEYLGPLGVVFTLTSAKGGFNAAGRDMRRRLRQRRPEPPPLSLSIAEPPDGRVIPMTVLTDEAGAAPNGATYVPARRRPFPMTITVQAAIGATAAVLGLVFIGLAWYHAGNTDQLWIQNQEFLSGGIGGLALVILGTGFLIRDQVVRDQSHLVEQLHDALVEQARQLRVALGTDESRPAGGGGSRSSGGTERSASSRRPS